MKTGNRAVIYARFSSHGQSEQSIEGQLHDNYAFAEREGYHVVGEYIDRAMTGRNDNRDDFQRMIADAAKGNFNIIIVWKLDRFARNRYDSAIYKARLKKHGVRVVSAMENITDSPEGIILEGMLESLAEYYSANLAVNVKRGMRETYAKGRHGGGNTPYGYLAVDGKYIPDERTAPIVQYVFEEYAKGVPKKQIVDDLKARGVRSPHGRELTVASFQCVLKNPVYIGNLMRNGQVVPDCATPLISVDLFNRVQEKLAATKRAPAARKAVVEYYLQGKVFCGECGAPMIGESGHSSTGRTHRYYSCAKRKKHHICNKKNERKEPLENYVIETTLNYVLSPDIMRDIADAVVSEFKKEFSLDRIADLERSIRQVDMDLEKLVDMLIDAPKAAHKRIYDRMENLEAQKADLESDISKLRIAQKNALTHKDVYAWLSQFSFGSPDDHDFCRRVIDSFINAVFVYDDRTVIFYNIRSTQQITHPQLQSTLTDPPTSSNSNLHGTPEPSKPEQNIIMCDGAFGYIFYKGDLR